MELVGLGYDIIIQSLNILASALYELKSRQLIFFLIVKIRILIMKHIFYMS